jgi:hypothetical protein
MERMRFRSTSAIDLMAELHQRDLLDEARRLDAQERAPVRRRARRLGLRIFGRRSRTG